MDLRQIMDAAGQVIQDHWVKFVISLCLLGIGVWWGRWRTYVAWTRKEFLGRLNISLNSIEDGVLKIRTLVEKDLREVFLNRFAVEAIRKAAGRTTPENPLLPLGDDDKWYLLNAVLNEVSEKFAEGYLRRDMGQPVAAATYLVCLTNECAGGVRTRKVRAMVIAKETLLRLPERVTFESPNHDTRVQTLRFLAEAYRRQPQDFLEMEICVGCSTTLAGEREPPVAMPTPEPAQASEKAPVQPPGETESRP